MPEFYAEEFISLIDNYETTAEGRALVGALPPTLLVGISGAGKDTIKNKLLESGDYSEMVSDTTRAPRLNNGVLELNGEDYHFRDYDKMYHMVRQQEFIEVKRVHGDDTEIGDVYGTTIAELEKARKLGKIAITDLDVQGVREYKKLAENTVAIFILPPNFETWIARLHVRYGSKHAFEADWPKRSRSAVKELKEALSLPYYHFITNVDIGHTAMIADEIAHRGDVFKRGDDEARLAGRDLLAEIEDNL